MTTREKATLFVENAAQLFSTIARFTNGESNALLCGILTRHTDSYAGERSDRGIGLFQKQAGVGTGL